MKPRHDGFIASVAERISDRFWSKVDRSGDGCWQWRGYVAPNGYGQFIAHSDEKSKVRRTLWAHRAAFVLMRGPIGDDLYLDHLCRNRGCVNPAHLEPVSARENLLRGRTKAAANAAKTHCDHGHELSGTNLYVWRGKRACKACIRIAGRKNDAKRRVRRNEQQRQKRAAAKHQLISAA